MAEIELVPATQQALVNASNNMKQKTRQLIKALKSLDNPIEHEVSKAMDDLDNWIKKNARDSEMLEPPEIGKVETLTEEHEIESAPNIRKIIEQIDDVPDQDDDEEFIKYLLSDAPEEEEPEDLFEIDGPSFEDEE